MASPETLQALPGWCQERLAFRGVLSSYQTNWEAAKSWMEALPAAHWSRELCALPRRATPAQTLDWMSLLERQADNEGMAAIRADLFKVSGSNAIRAGDLLGAFDLLSQSQNDPSLQTARLDIIGELVTYDPASVSEWMSQHPLPESERDGIISELCRSVPTEDSGSVDWAVMIQDPQRRSQVLLALFKRGVVPTLAHRKLIESWPTDNPVKQAIVDQKR